MSPPTAVRPSPPEQAGSPLGRLRPAHLAVAVAVVALLVAFTRLLEQPSFVERISFENPTVYDLSVEVSDAGRAAWSPIVTAGRTGTVTAEQVYDVGGVWVFRFSAQGREGGELRLTRAQLEADGWKVRIPERIGTQLQAVAAPPP